MKNEELNIVELRKHREMLETAKKEIVALQRSYDNALGIESSTSQVVLMIEDMLNNPAKGKGKSGDSLHCLVGPELFRFESFAQWVNKAASWFAMCEYPTKYTICVDAKGRICQYGKHFMTARNELAFPVRVCMSRDDDRPNSAICVNPAKGDGSNTTNKGERYE